ncbi:MAG: hypothetical protein IJ833_06590, partial [Lachnospiraceae bacterium]|nr:hypothetical protein [Lachnospiraceae bacterium]
EDKNMNVVIMESLGIGAEELASFQKPFEEKGVTFSSFEKTIGQKSCPSLSSTLMERYVFSTQFIPSSSR